MATGGFCGARARRREREAGTDGSSSGAHAGYTCGAWTVCEGGRRFACAWRGWHTRPWSWPMAPHATWVCGATHGGVGGRSEPCEGHRCGWLRCALKIYGQFCCGTRSRSHTRGQRERYTRGPWWWGGGIDVVRERGSRSIGIFVVYVDIRGRRGIHVHVVIELLHAVHGERWERYTWPHIACTGRDARDAREVAASRERPMRRKI